MNQFLLGCRTTDDKMSIDLEFDNQKPFKISKPTIVIFGGNPTTSETEAGRYARTVSNWLNEFGTKNKDNLDIASIVYSNGSPISTDYLFEGTYYDYNELAETILLPLISNQDGSKLDFNHALKNVSLVSFFGHSAGSMVMNNMMDKFIYQAKALGFSEQEIVKLCGQIKFLTFSPYQMVDAPIKAVYMTPSFDNLNSFYKAIEFMAQKQNVSTNNDFDFKKYINLLKSQSPRLMNYAQKMTNYIKNDGFMTLFDGESNLVVTPWKLSKFDESDHGLVGIVRGPNNEISSYSTEMGIKTSDFIEKMLTEFVKNSIANSKSEVPNEIDLNNLTKICFDIFKEQKGSQKI